MSLARCGAFVANKFSLRPIPPTSTSFDWSIACPSVDFSRAQLIRDPRTEKKRVSEVFIASWRLSTIDSLFILSRSRTFGSCPCPPLDSLSRSPHFRVSENEFLRLILCLVWTPTAPLRFIHSIMRCGFLLECFYSVDWRGACCWLTKISLCIPSLFLEF